MTWQARRQQLGAFFKREWGSLWLALIVLPALHHPWVASPGGHYEVFYEGAKMLWAGENPHARTFGSGYFNYHASLGLYFYGFFALFSYHVGLILYVLSSLIFCYLGARKFCQVIELDSTSKNIFFFLATSELLGTTQNVRLELFVLGSIFWSLSYLLQEKWAKSAWILAVPSVFKFQSIALAGLIGARAVKTAKARPWAFHFFIAFIFVFFSPVFVLGWGRTLQEFSDQNAHVKHLVQDLYTSLLHIFRFFDQLGMPISFETAGKICLFVAGAFAAIVFFNKRDFKFNVYLSTALASAYMTSFSLMSQSAAYCLALPLFAIALKDRKNRLIQIGVYGAWFLMSLLYSDLVPAPYRKAVFYSSIKSVGPLWLLAFWCWAQFKKSDQKVGQTTS